MPASSVRKLHPVDLLKIYGNLGYEWDLKNDTIDWHGPINKLLSPDSPFTTGSCYQNCLDPENFWRQMIAISQAVENGEHHYSCEYDLTLPTSETCHIIDQGEIYFDELGGPDHIVGSVRFLDHEIKQKNLNLTGYDLLTGYPGKEVLFENLASLLEQSDQTGIPGAYLSASIDRLTYLNCLYGAKETANLIKVVSEKLKSAIRFNDFVGRTSGCCFGIILKDCDRWGIMRASERLMTMLESFEIPVQDEKVRVTVSIGGVVFPDKDLTVYKVTRKAEKCLFEAQSIKGAGVSWAPYGRSAPEMKRPVNENPGRRRARDFSSQ